MNCYKDWQTVSVVVVTYNSSKYVLETLESIKNQTYPNISLIITDDCSTDKTVILCKDWIEKNRDRFVETIILESPVNTGVSANGNRGERACKTKWVKGIAGDDILLPTCIQDNMDYVKQNPDISFLFSKIKPFGASRLLNERVLQYLDYSFFDLGIEHKINRLVFRGNCIPAPSLFYNKEICQSVGIQNDERIPMLDDLPKWINILNHGFQLSFMDKYTVLYRVDEASLSNSSVLSETSYKSLRLFYYYYLREIYEKQYGLEKTIAIDVKYQVDIYRSYLKYKNLFFSRLYDYFVDIARRIILKFRKRD